MGGSTLKQVLARQGPVISSLLSVDLLRTAQAPA